MDLDECSQGYCGKNFGCTNMEGDFECFCGTEQNVNHTGFKLNETRAAETDDEEEQQCLDIDECLTETCPEKGTCKNTARDFIEDL